MAKQGKIIRNGIVYSGSGGGCDITYLTQAEYDALPDSKLTNGVEYRITDTNPPVPTAKDMAYDNSESSLDAETVQDAIDEIQNDVNSLNNSLTSVNGTASITGGTFGRVRLKRSGNVVSYSGFFQATSTNVIITLPEGFRPKDEIAAMFFFSDNDVITAGVNLDGQLALNNATVNKYYNFSFSFVI